MLNVSYSSLIACGIAIDIHIITIIKITIINIIIQFQIMIIHINFIYLLVYFMQKYSRTYCKNLHGYWVDTKRFYWKKGMWYRWGGILLSKVTVLSLTYEDSELICFKLQYVYIFLSLFLSEMSTVSRNDLNWKLWNAARDGNNDAVVAAVAVGGNVNWNNDSHVSDNNI